MTDRLQQMAQWMWDARQHRLPYANLPDNLTPASIAEAYGAQEIYYRMAEPVYGVVGGAKIATTTKVMQELMGIDHACGGAIFARTIHQSPAQKSPAQVRAADFVNLRIESEIALKLGADLPASGALWTRDSVASAVAGAMPAFELIEDRNADYTKTAATSLIVENCWNGGVVACAPKSVAMTDLIGIRGRLSMDGKSIGEGAAEDPAATLAWVANLLAERKRDLKAGMVVITGSLIATVSIARGQSAVFTVDGLGEVAMEVV
jgi:2-keto-4-pentenoate hydratase